ncbi:MAG: ABC transporter ATP-binding protein [Elusimicrobia bacterium HGW-Elusimicrobia-1]|jgi:ABC-type glutathione transport system ATPase component|nr:MAG: ABC transporter ATP-binding protein [Elusimicrobia bacterium HGW-Elusimicrobia-1]
MNTSVIEAVNIVKSFPSSGAFGRSVAIEALKGVSFSVNRGRALGILGESGSGKTTLAQILCGLQKADGGRILIDGIDRADIAAAGMPRKIQMVFQNPYASLNPKLSVGMQINEALNASAPKRGAWRRGAVELMRLVGLDGEFLGRFPHQLSGGQRQRVAIARALAPEPEILVADEAVSSLDVSVQAQILNLFRLLRRETGVTIIFISHDALAAAYVSDDLIVMKDGAIVESGVAAAILEKPESEYAALLVSAAKTLH